MIKVPIKPLSNNKMWLGRRRKSPAYRSFEEELYPLLPRTRIPRKGPLEIIIEVGYSNRASDIDNFIKPFLDILQKRYSFNDNRVYHLDVYKTIVNKEEEYIAFQIKRYEDDKNN